MKWSWVKYLRRAFKFLVSCLKPQIRLTFAQLAFERCILASVVI